MNREPLQVPRVRKSHLWAPVLDKKVRLDMGLYETSRAAIDQACNECVMPDEHLRAGCRRVWVAVERA